MEFMESPGPDAVRVFAMEFLSIVTTGESFGEFVGIRFEGLPLGDLTQPVQGTMILPLDGIQGMRDTIDEVLATYAARTN